MSIVLEIQCNHCLSLFDITEEQKGSWICPCQSKEGSTAFKTVWNTCGVDKTHHYWSNRIDSECRQCLDKKVNVITLERRGVKVDGNLVKLADDTKQTVDFNMLLMQGVVTNLEKEKQEQKETQLQILAELKRQDQSREQHDLEDK